ncbi:MAG TPA: transposase [Candidatus Dormibacteraeota bacterium]|nr:transposase [Candidatus Dormibacteraeota bacterium]
MGVNAMEREARRLEGLGQLGFDFRSTGAAPEHAQDQAYEADLFLEPEPLGLFVGSQRLNDYLREAGLGWVLKLAALLAEVDLSALTCRYQLSGRKAFHPRTLLGLIVYGILHRQWSLRELEALARRDVGVWLCGGHQPDHSTIGKFIELHAEVLTDEFFVALVKQLIVRLKLKPGVIAGDGTVVDAAASSYRLLRAEAMLQVAEETQARAAAEPDNWPLKRKAEATAFDNPVWPTSMLTFGPPSGFSWSFFLRDFNRPILSPHAR